MTTLTLDLPVEVFSALRRSPEEFGRELRLAAAIHWYQRTRRVAHVEEPAARRLVARLFDETGSPASGVVQLTPPANATSLEAEPIALDDGSFFFAFFTQSLSSHSAKVFIERFDPRTQSVEGPVVLAAGHLGGAMLAVNGSGKGVYVWQTLAPSEAVDNAYMRTVRITP
jgi:hypothetical protein